MPRPQYSRNGIVRAIEMSRCAVTVLVEGFIDRTFFGSLLNENAAATGKSFQIRLAHEVHTSLGNGKSALLVLHAKLKQNNRLMFTMGADKKAVLVFLDKDIDDLKRMRRRCAHTIYTEHYCVENYLFRHGDLIRTLTCGACLDCQTLGAFPSNQQWTFRAAKSWEAWIAFCLTVSKYGTAGLPNFGVESLIHSGPYSPLDAGKESTLLNAVAKKTGRTLAEVKIVYARELARVKIVLAADAIDQIFNGKWYSSFLAQDAKRLAAGRQMPSGLEDRLEGALLASLDFRTAWTNGLQQKITSVLAQI
jgi:hypothetical protein